MLVVTLNQSNAQLTTALYSRAKNEDENNSFIIDVNRWEWAINWRFQNIKSWDFSMNDIYKEEIWFEENMNNGYS